jgi:hypothetical protein
MASIEMGLLARQLSQLGQDLESEVAILGEMEDLTVTAEGAYRHYQELYDDAQAAALLKSRQGSAESRKAEARLACIEERQVMEQALLDWRKKQGALRTQNANIQAVHRRIEIGRSLLSREKAQFSLEQSGIA